MNLKVFIKILGLAFLFCPLTNLYAQAVTGKPNFVIIYMDDMGYGDVGAYGATGYNTPNINKMAAEGMRFTNFYSAQATCTASRAAILTGCYPNRVGMWGALPPNAATGLNPDEETIAELLKAKGYATGMIGKWHLGDAKQFLPLQQGFDYYYGIPYSNDMWPVNYDGSPAKKGEAKSRYPKLPLLEGNEPARFVENLNDMDQVTTWYTQKAVNFINQNHSKPFFLYFAQSMVHVPLGVSDKFKGKSKQGLFGDVMLEVDWSVSQIMEALKKQGIDKNTMVIFTSDNGPWLNYGNHAGSTGGLKEGKGTSWEGGQKEPFIVRWPGVVPAGTVCNNLACNIDILPTLATLARAKMPQKKIDGVDIFKLLKGDKTANPRNQLYYYYHKNDLEAVREGWWKLVFPHTYRSYENVLPKDDGFPGEYNKGVTGLALFDLRRDPGEHYDVKDLYPDVVKQLMDLAEQTREDLGDNLTKRAGANRRPAGKI